jgi:hypothetical protein
MWCGVVITFVRLELHSKWNTLPSIVFKVAPTQEALALPSLPLPPTPQPKEAPQTRTIPSAGPPLISLIIRAKNGNDSSQCGEYRISFLQRAQHHPSFDSRLSSHPVSTFPSHTPSHPSSPPQRLWRDRRLPDFLSRQASNPFRKHTIPLITLPTRFPSLFPYHNSSQTHPPTSPPPLNPHTPPTSLPPPPPSPISLL